MSFRPVFIAVLIAAALVVGAFVVNARRPGRETERASAALVRATGKCAECHRKEQHSIVHEYEMSKHAREGVNCLDCHQPAAGQPKQQHNGFTISTHVTAASCKGCHAEVYDQFLRSRHAAPAWAAVAGPKDFTEEQVAFSEKYHPGACKRPPNSLAVLEGGAATKSGCASCHSVGRPNPDGTIGTCTACHTRHTSSVEIARLPSTCGQCHLGPDHSQLEIYTESKHGVMFAAQRPLLRLDTPPKELTAKDQFVPTCTTCHMSGLNGLKVTHDTSERLSYTLFAEVTTKRPDFAKAQEAMKNVCKQCHTEPIVERVYREAEAVVGVTNTKVSDVKKLVDALRKEGVLKGGPFTHPIDFAYFDLWHYYGRTAKHGAFMGGADYVQWHGNYPILKHTVEIRKMADELRREHGKK